MRLFVTGLALLTLGPGLAFAADKPMRIWNLTAATIVDLKLAPSSATTFGRNLAKDDKDGAIDADERLILKDIAPGIYHAKVRLKDGRSCDVLKLELKQSQVASIEEKNLVNCVGN
jgi:hypothetical protein